MEFFERIAGVKKPKEMLLVGIEEEYRRIGAEFGYVMVQSPVWLMLKKQGSQAAFEVQFGSDEDFRMSLKKLVDSKSDMCFIITSKNAHAMRLEDVRTMLFKHFTIGRSHFVFVDIETGRFITVNFEWDKFSTEVQRPDWSRAGPMPPRPIFREGRGRRKKIYGKRGEHKEND